MHKALLQEPTMEDFLQGFEVTQSWYVLFKVESGAQQVLGGQSCELQGVGSQPDNYSII